MERFGNKANMAGKSRYEDCFPDEQVSVSPVDVLPAYVWRRGILYVPFSETIVELNTSNH